MFVELVGGNCGGLCGVVVVVDCVVWVGVIFDDWGGCGGCDVDCEGVGVMVCEGGIFWSGDVVLEFGFGDFGGGVIGFFGGGLFEENDLLEDVDDLCVFCYGV